MTTHATQPDAPAYSLGLEGVIAGETSICHVDPSGILLYRGYDIHELATKTTFEQIVSLLVHGQLPDDPATELLRQELATESRLPSAVVNLLRLVPPTVH